MTREQDEPWKAASGTHERAAWSRRRFIGAAATMAVLATAARAAPERDARWAGYADAIVVDACGGLGDDGSTDGDWNLSARELEDLRDSGVTLVNTTVSGVGSYAEDFEKTVKNIAHWDAMIEAHPDLLLKWTRGEHTAEAKRSRRIAVSYAFQDATPFGESLDRFELFHDLGVRVIQPTYNRRNLMGDGCLEPGDAGLSQLGRELVARCNEKRVLLDVSHCGRRTSREMFEASKQPVAITHAGCRALADLPRNKSDEDLRRMADKGGVVGIYFMPYLRAEGQPMAADVVAHVRHAVNVCGEDHVGLGTDGGISPVALTEKYKQEFRASIMERRKLGISAPGESPDVYTFVPDLNRARRFETLASKLSDAGLSPAQIDKILGANFARLFADVIG